MGRPLFTIVRDTAGYHDTLAGACSAEINLVRYGVRDTPNCRDTFLRGLSPFGLGKKDIVPTPIRVVVWEPDDDGATPRAVS